MTLSEAHKTGKRYRRKDIGTEYFRYSDGDRPIAICFAIADDWEVELEVYVVECVWCGIEKVLRYYPIVETLEDVKKLKDLVGKRTKLTIEVLD